MNRESCIQTIELLKQLALNIHGVIDVIDDRNCNDIINLLKEQDAVEPTLIREGRNKHYNDYVCPRCDNEVVYEQNYCSECGVQFLWEGR